MKAQLSASLVDIWDGVRAQPGRVGLAFLAIAVGITALTVLLAVLGGLNERSRRIVEELGVNVFGIVQSGSGNAGETGARLDDEHVDMLSANLPGCVVSGLMTYDVPAGGQQKTVKVVATDSSLFRVRQWRIRAGRFIDEEDVRTRARSAVVSSALSTMWGWDVGSVITLRQAPYNVVGIVDVGGSALQTESGDSHLVLGDRVVFVPRSTPPYWMTFGARAPQLDSIFVLVPSAGQFARVVSVAQRILQQPDHRVSGLSWITPESLLQGLKRLQNTIKLTVGSIAVLCLILGGTTLMSLMVANVRDRVVEIGLRRALGATRQDIAGLFVLEACLVTAAAALAGTTVTHVLLFLGREAFPVPLRFGLQTLFVPMVVAVGLGVVFSYWPARSAAMIAPSEALRNE